jgi:hypothetical protein
LTPWHRRALWLGYVDAGLAPLYYAVGLLFAAWVVRFGVLGRPEAIWIVVICNCCIAGHLALTTTPAVTAVVACRWW